MKKHNHNLVTTNEKGEYALQLMCPDCEASGRELTREEVREGLIRFERLLQSWGYALTDAFDGEVLEQVQTILYGFGSR